MVLLFKGALGFTGGGVGGLMLLIVVFYYIYRKEKYGDAGCLSVFLLPLLPIGWLISGFSKANEKAIEYKFLEDRFEQPPSLLLKIMVALSLLGLWVMGIGLYVNFDVSTWWYIVLVFFPLLCINLYMFWLKVFFVELAKLRKPIAIAICVVLIILIVVFWIVAIKAYQHYTSIDYLRQYWARKYNVI